MSIKYKIRHARVEDVPYIVKFNASMAAETESIILDHAILVSGVSAVIDDPGKGFYIVVEAFGKPQGCLMITTEWSDWRNGLFWWIQSVFIHPKYRRLGLYKAMYRYIEVLIKDNPDIVGIRLYVDKENTLAQKTYEALGMMETDYLLYESIK